MISRGHGGGARQNIAKNSPVLLAWRPPSLETEVDAAHGRLPARHGGGRRGSAASKLTHLEEIDMTARGHEARSNTAYLAAIGRENPNRRFWAGARAGAAVLNRRGMRS